MKAINLYSVIELSKVILTVAFILFWLYAVGTQLSDFNKFKGEMINQVFSRSVSGILAYVLPVVEITIATLLVFASTRLMGLVLSFLMMLVFSTYVGLALLNLFKEIPCNCAGLLGSNSTWETNLILNLIVTAVAAIGIILQLKFKERRIKVWVQ